MSLHTLYYCDVVSGIRGDNSAMVSMWLHAADDDGSDNRDEDDWTDGYTHDRTDAVN